MQIIVIDNFIWNENGAGFADIPPYDYISTRSKSFEGIIKDLNEIYSKFEDLIFLINVHCQFSAGDANFKRCFYLQDQHGITIYRHLLKAFESKSDKLKVAFFSPIPKSHLVKLKPENKILEFHQVFEVPFTWETVIKSLKDKELKRDWSIFNNASENLLSGYSKYSAYGVKSAEINIGHNKKILFVDDQSKEWQTTFNQIFQKDVITNLGFSNQDEFKNALENGKVLNEVKSKISECSIVLSDLYLKENHLPSKWMNKQRIESLSGFKLFKSIKDEDKGKAIPFIMHTSSNKISYYKVFDQHGVDDWIVKDTRVNAPLEEKKDNYELFKKTIEDLSSQLWIYERMQSLWITVQSIRNNRNENWWYSAQYSDKLKHQVNDNPRKKEEFLNCDKNEFTKKDIISLLESSWFVIRRYLNQEVDYEKTSQWRGIETEAETFLTTSICNNLGKIFEMLGIKSGFKRFSFLTNFIINVRNSASHASDSKFFILMDAFICLDYVVYALNNYNDLSSFKADFADRFIIKGLGEDEAEIFPCGLLWIYIQFYNHSGSKVLPETRKVIRKERLNGLFKQALADGSISYVWELRKELSNDYKRTKDWHMRTFIVDNVTSPELNENRKGPYLKILIPLSWQ